MNNKLWYIAIRCAVGIYQKRKILRQTDVKMCEEHMEIENESTRLDVRRPDDGTFSTLIMHARLPNGQSELNKTKKNPTNEQKKIEQTAAAGTGF